MIENYIIEKKKHKDLLLMTHLVIGYPSIEKNYEAIDTMVESGVDLIELQIPFSEPTADGPTILKANHSALLQNTRLSDCFEFIQNVSSKYSHIPFLIMTYYNILFSYDEEKFIRKAKQMGVKGFIIPDLPPEEAKNYLTTCRQFDLDTIFIFTPTTEEKRLSYIETHSSGFIYCVGRKGVTGTKTNFTDSTLSLIQKYKNATHLPLAFGFGVQEKADLDILRGQVEIAVIGSKLIQVQETEGTKGLKSFLNSI